MTSLFFVIESEAEWSEDSVEDIWEACPWGMFAEDEDDDDDE